MKKRIENNNPLSKRGKQVNFWLHITHGQYKIKTDFLKKRFTVETYIDKEQVIVNEDLLKEYPLDNSLINYIFEFGEFNELIKVKYGVDILELDYDATLNALRWYKGQAISGKNLKGRLFVKFYGDLDNQSHACFGRKPLDFDKQLEKGNIIQDVEYGVGLSAGNINDWISCYEDRYGEKFMILKPLWNQKYMFSGKIRYYSEQAHIDMLQGRQIVGMKFRVIDRGSMGENGERILQKYMEKE